MYRVSINQNSQNINLVPSSQGLIANYFPLPFQTQNLWIWSSSKGFLHDAEYLCDKQ